MFLRQMTDAFLVRTEPDSSIVKPAHIHMMSAPQMRNEKVLRTNWVSLGTDAQALPATTSTAPPASVAAMVTVREESGRAAPRTDGSFCFIAYPPFSLPSEPRPGFAAMMRTPLASPDPIRCRMSRIVG